jgi:hypothetical protein
MLQTENCTLTVNDDVDAASNIELETPGKTKNFPKLKVRQDAV